LRSKCRARVVRKPRSFNRRFSALGSLTRNLISISLCRVISPIRTLDGERARDCSGDPREPDRRRGSNIRLRASSGHLILQRGPTAAGVPGRSPSALSKRRSRPSYISRRCSEVMQDCSLQRQAQ
jgi:hypothetical protein